MKWRRAFRKSGVLRKESENGSLPHEGHFEQFGHQHFLYLQVEAAECTTECKTGKAWKLQRSQGRVTLLDLHLRGYTEVARCLY